MITKEQKSILIQAVEASQFNGIYTFQENDAMTQAVETLALENITLEQEISALNVLIQGCLLTQSRGKVFTMKDASLIYRTILSIKEVIEKKNTEPTPEEVPTASTTPFTTPAGYSPINY